jgi:hypothetical protein
MNEAAIKYFEGLITLYTDNIRQIDFKSNVMIFFLSISISTVSAFRLELPKFVPVYILLALPLCSIMLFIFSIYPRIKKVTGFPFYANRKVVLEDIVGPPEGDEAFVLQLRRRCVALANIFSRKIFLFKTSMIISLVYLAVLFVMAVCGGLLSLAS